MKTLTSAENASDSVKHAEAWDRFCTTALDGIVEGRVTKVVPSPSRQIEFLDFILTKKAMGWIDVVINDYGEMKFKAIQ